ncbi:MAG TPA: phosphomannomutase/phosphoglucomutase [Chthonomonadaceae bacterium]|nr:phosphomannomutase/phosphoglucomutase [Chthonomonadaceae bacterium]
MATVDPRVFRTYDIRALVPELVDEDSLYYGQVGAADAFQAPLTPEGVERIGRGLAAFFASPTVVIGHDARLSSPEWAIALACGLNRQGVDVLDIGLATTDMVYYASGKLALPAVIITASHCTKELNGMKLVKAGAHVVGKGAGMEELRDLVLAGTFGTANRPGRVTRRSLLDEYLAHLRTFVAADQIAPLRLVADAGNGVGGLVARPLLSGLPQLEVTALYFEPDGRFPHHEANPFVPENIIELQARVPASGADLGVAWDGDADRVVFLDERGRPVPGDFVTALVARHFLERHPGAGIVYDLRASWAVKEWVERLGGRPISERVGHSYIKRTMRAEDAVFGGEVSGHYYFRDHYYADNGFIPLLSVLRMLSEANVPLSQLVASLGEYYLSGEINSTVSDVEAVLARLQARYADGVLEFRDGLSVEYPDWHFNVRPSANDPVVRLNLEARTQEKMEQKREEVLALIRQE